MLKGLVSSLKAAKPHLESDDDDFGFLSELLNSRELQALVQVHSKVNYTFIRFIDYFKY